MFAKCGSFNDAIMIFEEMPYRDLKSWTVIICGAVHNREYLEAMCLFKRMRIEGFRPDSVSVVAVLPACSRLECGRSKALGMTLHGCAISCGFEDDLFVSNALIDMYCKCGDTLKGQSVFCNMVHKDAVSWGTLIAGYSQNCECQKSVDLYMEMTMSGLRTNAVTVASVLPGFGKLGLLKQGKEMHNYILKQGFEDDNVVGSALIDMYSNCGSSREAEHVFEFTSHRDIMLWNSMIAGHSGNDQNDSAFRVFRGIWDCKLKPNSITLMSILPVCTKLGALKQGKEIHGHAIRSSLLNVTSVGNSLIDMYCKCGFLQLGVNLFNCMMEKNAVTYNTIISSHGIHGCAENAFSFFHQMKAARVKPTKLTFIALLSACSHAGLVDRGWSLFNSMVNHYGMQPDMEHYSCMVDLLGRAGQIEEACNFISRMPIKPENDIWLGLLGACRLHNKLQLAKEVGDHILQTGSTDSGCHILMSNLYASAERWEDASKVRIMLKENGLTKKPGHSWIQVDRQIHVFKARQTNHTEFENVSPVLENLLLEMKREENISEPNLLP
ncbi:putative Tetratricopeptide repeat-like superfamily protein [Heracleum sosnowskyi]|uniref:Tetratricopeptide repeat-like superfamily protein n=1 Tax=Heracleum sosnowskyi TaxID=360622 RepID=A0AAD8MV26_9APIA|nr:putative Tetratricopeptide repeat-like superfamily protein [Heracleum sosnowskyi]